MVFTNDEIEETVRGFRSQKLDIRIITMGMLLRYCTSSLGEKAWQKIYDKICRTEPLSKRHEQGILQAKNDPKT